MEEIGVCKGSWLKQTYRHKLKSTQEEEGDKGGGRNGREN